MAQDGLEANGRDPRGRMCKTDSIWRAPRTEVGGWLRDRRRGSSELTWCPLEVEVGTADEQEDAEAEGGAGWKKKFRSHLTRGGLNMRSPRERSSKPAS